MSKKIRVEWDDLQPGDLVHVKGSTNTYVFKGWFLDAASVDHRKSGAETYVITRSKNNSPVDIAMGLYYAEVIIPDWKAKARKHMTAGNELLAYTQSELFRCVMEFLADAVKTTEEEQ